MNPQAKTTWPATVRTLAVDIGGSGIKASVLNPQGEMVVDRVRLDTPYPCPPATLVRAIEQVVSGMRDVQRASVGFPAWSAAAGWSKSRRFRAANTTVIRIRN